MQVNYTPRSHLNFFCYDYGFILAKEAVVTNSQIHEGALMKNSSSDAETNWNMRHILYKPTWNKRLQTTV